MFSKRKSPSIETPAEQALSSVLKEVATTPVAQVDPPSTSVFPSLGKSKAPAVVQLPASEKPSIINEGFEIKGELKSTGILHVEGKVTGQLTAHTVNISPGGVVDGELQCTSLNIKGTFTGTAVCDDLVIASSARLDGNISYRFITIGAGAVIKGDLHCL